jgi:hypothetical protein
MGWLNTLLDAGILAAQVSSMSKLETMKKQGAEAATLQAILTEIRRQIFNYKQEAEEILSFAEAFPKQAAAGMKLLELRLQSSGITPDLFPDLNDKEYAAATARFIRDQYRRLFALLSATEQTEVKTVVSTVSNLQDYTYYLKHYQKAQTYRASLQVYKQLEPYNGPQQQAIHLTAWGLIGVSLCMVMGSSIAGRSAGSFFSFLGMLMLCGGIALRFWSDRRRKAGTFNQAKKTVAEIGQEIDIELFDRLDREFGGDYNRALDAQREAQAVVSHFFDENGDFLAVPVAATSAPTANAAMPSQNRVPATSTPSASQPTATRTTIYCARCGTANAAGGKFCMKCGQALIT